jgi:hypothetical protein
MFLMPTEHIFTSAHLKRTLLTHIIKLNNTDIISEPPKNHFTDPVEGTYTNWINLHNAHSDSSHT